MKRFRTYGLLLIFAAILAFPMFNDKYHFVEDIANFENRRLAVFPKIDSVRPDSFATGYDRYYNDHFTLRSLIIKGFNLYNILAYKKSPLPDKVIIGKDGWLFPVGEELESYQGRNRLTPQELNEFKLELEYRQKYLAQRGCKLYFMIAPCKASIYSDKIGYQYFRMNEQSWGEQLNEYLSKHCTVKPINAFDVLRKKKDEQQLYFRLDNHWNQIGAFYAATSVIEHMKKDFPQLQAMAFSDFKVVQGDTCEGNIQTMLGKLPIYSEPCLKVEPKTGFRSQNAASGGYPSVQGFAYGWLFEADKEKKNSNEPKLLFITDSFGENIFPFLAENFSRSVKIWDAWLYRLNENIVEGEKPDAMLIMIDEPILRNFLKNPSRPQ